MESFNNLPSETKLEILKYYPSYRTLSTQYYNQKQLFYDLYCHHPISKKELFNYIYQQPDLIIIYGTSDDIYTMFKFLKYDNFYNLITITLFIVNIDIDEYTVETKQSSQW